MRQADVLTEDRSATELLREMREKAQGERERIFEEARRRAAEIEEQSRRECERLEGRGVAEAERDAAAERERLLGKVREEARTERLALKHAAIDRVFEEAREAIEKRVGGAEWEEALAALLDEAVGFVGSEATLFVNRGDLAGARAWTESSPGKYRVEESSGPRGSVAATSSDGKRRADNGLQARLDRVRQAGSARVARELFKAR